MFISIMAALGEDPNKDPLYARPINRSPENMNSNIAKLPSEDRAKIYGLRSGLENILAKVHKLEETNEEKELEVERERQLRKNLEDKILQTGLTDMYGDPSVNEELNERLPKAARQRLYKTPRSGRSSPKKHRRQQSDSDGEYSDDDRRHAKHNSFPGAMYHPSYMYPPGVMPFSPGMIPPQFYQSTPSGNPGAAFQGMPLFPNLTTSFPQSDPPTAESINKRTSTQKAHDDELKSADLHNIQAASMLNADSQARQIARLLQEIDLLKQQNRQLSEELKDQISECKALEVEKELRNASTNEQVSSRATALIQEVYRCQKQRDEAMMERLKLANQERDKALHMLSTIRNGSSVHEVLECHNDSDQSRVLSALDVKAETNDLIAQLQGSKMKINEVSCRQIRNLTTERNEARDRVSELENELMKVTRQVEELIPVQEELLKMKKQLLMTQQERDQSLTYQRRIEEENETLKLYNGLHKSLSKEQSLRDQYNNSLDQMQQLIIQREGHVVDAQKETNKLQAIIQDLTSERETLSMELEKAQAIEGEHQRSNEKLQRHVAVLQRKLKKLAASNDQGAV